MTMLMNELQNLDIFIVRITTWVVFYLSHLLVRLTMSSWEIIAQLREEYVSSIA